MRRWFASVATMGALTAGGCAGSVIVNPSWDHIPDMDSMGEAYPVFAGMVGIEGDVQLGCVGLADGRLANCEVTRATPAGLGFEAAALSNTDEYRLNPRQVDGESAKSRVAFMVRFRWAPDEGPPPWTGPEPSPDRLASARAAVGTAEAMFPGTPPPWIPLGVAPDREEKVREMIRLNAAAFQERHREALITVMARSWTPEQLAFAATREGPPPPAPDFETMFPAGAELMQLEEEAMAALKERYCRSYACPAVSPRPSPPSEERATMRP